MTNIVLKHNIAAQCYITRLYICSTSIVPSQIIETAVIRETKLYKTMIACD